MTTPNEGFDGDFDKGNDTIFFAIPEAAVTPHLISLGVLARTMMELGYRVLFARCAGHLPRCPVFEMHGLPIQMPREECMRHSCISCVKTFHSIVDEYRLPWVDINQYLQQVDYEEIDAALPAPSYLNLDFIWRDVKFGKVGAWEAILVRKKFSVEAFNEEDRAYWFRLTQTAMISYLASLRILGEHRVKRVCTFNTYCSELGPILAAKALGIPNINVTSPAHKDIDRQRFLMLPNVYTLRLFEKQMRDWHRWRDLSIPPGAQREIVDDIILRQTKSGINCYSPSKTFGESEITLRLGLDPARKLLVAYTSSPDEISSGRMLAHALGDEREFDFMPFKSQGEWLKALVHYVETSEDLQLVIRIHPREGPVMRGSMRSESEHFTQLASSLSGTYKFCKVIWPQDAVSSYDLADQADLILSGWSSMGLEMARVGVPVLAAFRGIRYPDDTFMPWGGETIEEFFLHLRRLLDTPPSLENIMRAFRCYHFLFLASSLRLDDIIPETNSQAVPLFHLPREAANVERVFMTGIEPLSINRQRLLDYNRISPVQQEFAELRRQLLRVIHFYCTGNSVEAAPDLMMIGSSKESVEKLIEQARHLSQAVLIREGKRLHYVFNGKEHIIRSVLVQRLASIVVEAVDETDLGTMQHRDLWEKKCEHQDHTTAGY